MIFSPRISKPNLIQLCRRVGNQLRAGVDIRRVWLREAERGSGAMKQAMLTICEGIEEGNHMHEAINFTGEYFPKLFRQMIQLGDQTGHLDLIFLDLADQYEHQMELRRAFLATIMWPVIQLVMAIFIVGGLIFFMGAIAQPGREPIDPLGVGLVGTQGAIDYFLIVGMLVLGGFVFYFMWSRGKFDFLQLDRLVLRIPMVGKQIRTLCLARMAWALGLTVGGGMEIRRAMRLSLEATQNRYYYGYADRIDKELLCGDEISEILRRTRAFPHDFLDVVETGEISGTLSESMMKLSELYFEKAKAAMKSLAVIGGTLVWMMIAGLIIAVIFKLFLTVYMGPINEALDMLKPGGRI